MGLYRYTRWSFLREVAVGLLGILFCVPLYIVVVMALKSPSGIALHPLSLPTRPVLGNFATAWTQSNGTATVSQAFVSNVIITASVIVLTIAFGSACAYTLARRASKLSSGLYLLFTLGLVMPFQLGIVPLYVLLRDLHLVGQYLGIILLQTGLYMPLAVFLYARFIKALPRDYEDAAQVDGAGHLRILIRVLLPLLNPITGTIAILVGVFTWNEFFLSIIFLGGTPNEPLSVAIYSFSGAYTSQWNVIFAAILISIAPILVFYVFVQKKLIKGLTGGIRG